MAAGIDGRPPADWMPSGMARFDARWVPPWHGGNSLTYGAKRLLARPSRIFKAGCLEAVTFFKDAAAAMKAPSSAWSSWKSTATSSGGRCTRLHRNWRPAGESLPSTSSAVRNAEASRFAGTEPAPKA